MKKFAAIGLCFFALVVTVQFVPTATGEGQTLREKKQQQAEQDDIQTEVTYTNEQCGTAIKAFAEFESGVTDAPIDLASSCNVVLSALEQACTDPVQKEKIKQSVTAVSCAQGEGRALTLSDGTLKFQHDAPREDDFDYVSDYLTTTLP